MCVLELSTDDKRALQFVGIANGLVFDFRSIEVEKKKVCDSEKKVWKTKKDFLFILISLRLWNESVANIYIRQIDL